MLEMKLGTARSLARILAAPLACASVLAISTPASAQEAQVESGFGLEANVNFKMASVTTTGGGGGLLGNGGTNTVVTGNPAFVAPGLILGYKTGRIFIGLGFEFSNSTSNQTTQTVGTPVTTTSVTTSNTNFLIGPDFQFAMVRSADLRVELIGDLALHFGHEFSNTTTTTTPAPPPTNGNAPATDSNFLLSYRLGPGVRFWAHRHFALQAVVGFTGQALFDLPVNNNPANGNNSQHSLFSSIGALGAF
jgi:hypothetical protein